MSVVPSAAEFRRLPLVASVPRLQPADGRGLVHVDLIVWTDPQPQTFATSLLGVPVQVRATPSRFVWDFGDGSEPLVTTDAGAPWPEHTVARPYDHAGEYALTLTTTWSGQYRVNGAGPWLPVLGTATTTSTPVPTEVVQADAYLVAGPET